jgi:DNA-binding PadR family transcriptional regulator
MTESDVARFLPLRPRVFAILLALAERPMHGYGVMKTLADAGEGWLLGPGTLYRLLKEMQQDGLIVVAPGEARASDGPPRRNYMLSGFGRRVAVAEGRRMERLVARTREMLIE